jgi:hypothetical protein
MKLDTKGTVLSLTSCVKQRPSSESSSHSASQDIPHLLRHPVIHYRVHNGPYRDISQQPAFHYDSMLAEPDLKFGGRLTVLSRQEHFN